MKKILLTILSLLGVIGFAFASFPFFMSLNPSENAVNNSVIGITIPALIEGIPAVIKIGNADLILLKPTSQQLTNLVELNTKVWSKTTNTYNSELQAFVYWGISTKRGCTLEHKPPHESGIKEYDKKALWLGGYWDYTCEVSYDYSGRAIKEYAYTYNGYTLEAPNLSAPSIFKKHGDHYTVSIYQR